MPAPTVPGVPLGSLVPAAVVQELSLSVSAATARPLQSVVLTATSGATVTGSAMSIEIFDQTTGAVVAACGQGSQCIVDYAAQSGVHNFVAVIARPTTRLPTLRSTPMSNIVSVRWSGITIGSANTVVGPGKTLTVTATSDIPAHGGEILQLYDADTNARLTYCSHGNTCSVSLTKTTGGARRVIASLAKPSDTLPDASVQTESAPLTLTWVTVTISGTALYQIGSSISLTATASADLTSTPWSLGILNDRGHLVAPPCKTGTTCTAQVAQAAAGSGTFTAVIGAAPTANGRDKIRRLVERIAGPVSLGDLQAKSSAVRPLRLLWGVDSCKSFTDDPSAGGGLYPQIAGILGAPDFWGRYLTDTICPGLSATEVAAAHTKHMGILPIYNDYICSNVAGYDVALQYAASAVSAARKLGIPAGHGLAIDIEPPGDSCPGAANLDTGFINGWYNGIKGAGYSPIFYGDGTSSSVFATQWCLTVSALPYIGHSSYVWSSQPSLYGGYMKSNAPGYSPNLTGCVGYVHAWQYQLGSEGQAAPDVDSDEATSELPLWYP